MKVHLFLFIIVNVFVATKGFSQDGPKGHKVFLGLSAGQSTTTFVGSHIDYRLDNSPNAYMRSRKGLLMAMHVKMLLSKQFYLRPGLSYIQKGAKEMNSSYTYNFQADLDYLSFPLLAGFQPVNFDNSKRLNVYVEGGIVPSLEVSRKNDNLKKGFLSEPEIKTTVFSYQLGAGIEVKVAEAIVCFANYSYFRDINSFFEVFENPTYEVYNRGSAISAGVMLNLD
jgi:opacity protein-like surface antigen